MALFPISLPPGVYRSGTILQSSGRFYDTDLVRWGPNGALQPIGGWTTYSTSVVIGKARAIHIWSDNDGGAQCVIGTHSRLYALDRGGILYDITPLRATTTPTDPFDTTSGSPDVLVTDTAHGALVGDTVIISDATAVGGLTPDGEFTIKTVPSVDTYTIELGSNASSTANGGGTVTLEYLIHPGRADSDSTGGYGNELYGEGLYGTPRSVSLDPHDVTVWTLDNFGQDLVCVNADDGVVYTWALDTSTRAEALTDAPTGRALVVTPERILMVLGADGNPKAVAWSDQEDDTQWTPSTTNYAGDFNLQTTGKLMAGRRVRGGTLLLTSTDTWLAEFLGQPLIYGFTQVGGAGTGIIAQGAVAAMDGEAVPVNAVWMGQQGFFGFNGTVQAIDCEVAGLVFTDINRDQISKVSAFHDADWGEVWWFYPSAGSNEIDRYVFWDYRKNIWGIGGSMVRLCGSEKGPLPNPLCVDSLGQVFKQEYGLAHDTAQPYAETGPFLIGQGDKVVQVLGIIPDERTLGDVEAKFFLRFQPNGPETEKGPYSLADQTDVRFTARQIRVRLTGDRLADWRVGNFKLDGVPGGLR